MLKIVKDIINKFDSYYLLGYNPSHEGDHFYLMEIQYQKNDLNILHRKEFTSFQELIKSDSLKASYPIILHIWGDKVISKETNNKTGYRNNLVFKTNPDDYYFYEYHGDNKILLSLTRKNLVNQLISELNEVDKHIVHVSIGPFVVLNLFPILDVDGPIIIGDYKIHRDKNQLVDFEKAIVNEDEVQIGKETLNFKEIGVISSFLEFKFKNEFIEFDTSFLTKNIEEQRFKTNFKIFGASALVFFMLLLFIGHLTLNNKIRKLAEIESKYSVSQQTLMNIKSLEDEIVLKEKILLSNRIVNNKYLTQYFMELGNSIPKEIGLSKIDIMPLEKKVKVDEKLIFLINEISIIGETVDDEAFSIWVKDIKALSWLKKIEIMDFQKIGSKSEFVLKVMI